MLNQHISFCSETFEHSWTRFGLVAKAKDWNGEKQLAVIRTLLTGKQLDYYVDLNAEEKADMDTLKMSLIKKVGLKKNATVAVRDFHDQVQGPTKRARDFAMDLKKKFKQACSGEAATSAVLLQRFMTGLQPGQLLLRGQLDSNSTSHWSRLCTRVWWGNNIRPREAGKDIGRYVAKVWEVGIAAGT